MEVLKNISGNLQLGDLGSIIRIIVGGAPVSQDFADEIGTDGHSYDAGSTVELVKRLMGIA